MEVKEEMKEDEEKTSGRPASGAGGMFDWSMFDKSNRTSFVRRSSK